MKTRKKPLYGIAIALTVVKFCLFTSTVTAQNAQGIYLNAADFTSNKLSYAQEAGEKCKIKIHDGSFNAHIRVTCGTFALALSKDSVFGYKDHENVSHRFFNKTIYEILNPGANILLYRIRVAGKTKYEEATYNYFCSKEASAPIFPLTIKNLETAFSENQMFIDFLEVHFKTDGDLREYDSNHVMYKVNYLLELSKNQK